VGIPPIVSSRPIVSRRTLPASRVNLGGRAASRAHRDDGFPARRSTGPLGERIREPRDPAELAHQPDVDFYVGEFERTKFSGGLKWYEAPHRLSGVKKEGTPATFRLNTTKLHAT